jgi:DNA-directed RNA polymerase specialized sigma24 family protein
MRSDHADPSAVVVQEERVAFPATHWTVVLAARGSQDTQAGIALENLCRAYWYPLYAFIRRQGYDAPDAQDLTQGFFARLLEKDYLADVDRRKGRFRSFLLAAIKHFLADERDKASAQKRGGGQVPISLDAQAAEDRFRLEPAHELTPEKLFERRWASSLLGKAFDRLAQDYAEADKQGLFAELQEFLAPGAEAASYALPAQRLHMNEGAVRMAVHRLRQRYGQLFREEVAHTVADPNEIEEEMRHLRRVLRD